MAVLCCHCFFLFVEQNLSGLILVAADINGFVLLCYVVN